MEKRKLSNWIGPIFLISFIIFISGFTAGLDDGSKDRKMKEVKQSQKTEIEKVKQDDIENSEK